MVARDLLCVAGFAVRVAVSAKVACCGVRFVTGPLWRWFETFGGQVVKFPIAWPFSCGVMVWRLWWCPV